MRPPPGVEITEITEITALGSVPLCAILLSDIGAEMHAIGVITAT